MNRYVVVDDAKLALTFNKMSARSQNSPKYREMYMKLLKTRKISIASTDIIGNEFMMFLEKKGAIVGSIRNE